MPAKERGQALEDAAEEWWHDCPVGALCRVEYVGDPVDHERVMIWPSLRKNKAGKSIQITSWWVLSPDGDVWEEDMAAKDEETGPKKARPLAEPKDRGRGGRRLYRFREYPSEAEVVKHAGGIRRQMLEEGQAATYGPETIRLPDGDVKSGRGVFPWAPRVRLNRKEALEDDPDEYVWVLTETDGKAKFGAEVELNSDSVKAGSNDALVKKDGEYLHARRLRVAEVADWIEKNRKKPSPASGEAGKASSEAALGGGAGRPRTMALDDPEEPEDARTLWVEWDDHGDRYRSFRSAVAESRSHDWGHPRLEGAPTALHTCRMMERFGQTPRGWLERYLREKGLSGQDRVAHEMRSLVDILEEGACFDQVNLGGLVCMELAARRLNLIVDAHRGGKPNYANAKYLTPADESEEIMNPNLRSHMARRATEDYTMMQGQKKAEAVQGGKGGGAESGLGDQDGETGKGGRGDPKGRGKNRSKGVAPPEGG